MYRVNIVYGNWIFFFLILLLSWFGMFGVLTWIWICRYLYLEWGLVCREHITYYICFMYVCIGFFHRVGYWGYMFKHIGFRRNELR